MTKANKFVYWTPRILTILFILFLAIFSLDVFEGNPGFWNIILGLFMHNLPSLILLIVLIIAWRRELVGAISFILAGFGLIILVGLKNNVGLLMLFLLCLMIAGPAFLIGVLFFVGWKRKKRKEKK